MPDSYQLPTPDEDRPNIECCSYSREVLKTLLVEHEHTVESAVDRHLEYLEEYLGHFQAAAPETASLTIVVERSYTDRDFLDDYAAYYVRCFGSKYPSKCSRLHFFQASFDDNELRKAMQGSSEELNQKTLQNKYLGFIVVKPLPERVIGRTCLKTYAPSGRRVYSVVRDYPVHLLGFELSVRSLAFQEQDRVAAACATSALWSVFHGTGMLFHHSIPSPIEITRIATAHMTRVERDFPSTGLYPEQMAAAIKGVGLEPEFFGVSVALDLKAITYAYLNAEIPVVMNAALYDTTNEGQLSKATSLHGGHAVAITGYNVGLTQAQARPPTGAMFRSAKIDKLYVHDDGVGPFARMPFDDTSLVIPKELIPEEPWLQEDKTMEFSLRSSWPALDGTRGRTVFVPEALILPLYHKIRIRFDTIYEEVLKYDSAIESLRALFPPLLAQRVEWDVFLSRVGDLKSDLREKNRRKKNLTKGNVLWNLLTRPLPRFIWRAIAYRGSDEIMEFLFDATDIEQGGILTCTIIYDDIWGEFLRLISSDAGLRNVISGYLEIQVIDGWLEHLVD